MKELLFPNCQPVSEVICVQVAASQQIQKLLPAQPVQWTDINLLLTNTGLSRIWLITDFCARHRIGSEEMERLNNLFVSSATADQLLSNARREPSFS
ncbi:hypothetical protein GFM07_22510 [Rhizobium leguminosarum bv. viciae]|nr:hypothetical protein [Rhizobium leguminosarum bv. viciae]